MVPGQDTMQVRSTLTAAGKEYDYYSLPKAYEQLGDLSKLPFSLKVLLENLLRFEDGKTVTTDDIKAFASWMDNKGGASEIAYRPARVLLQDFTVFRRSLTSLRCVKRSLNLVQTQRRLTQSRPLIWSSTTR